MARSARDHVRARHARAHGLGKHVAARQDAPAKEDHSVRLPRAEAPLDGLRRERGHIARPEKRGELIDVFGKLAGGHGDSSGRERAGRASRPLSREREGKRGCAGGSRAAWTVAYDIEKLMYFSTSP